MAALPYMQLYVADYLADAAHLNAAQHGAYLLLLMNYWQRGKALKNDDVRLANVARMTADEWERNRDLISEFFTVTDDEWMHDRVERDLEAVSSKSTQAKAAGKASAERRLNRRSTDVERPLQRTLNHTDTDTDKEESRDTASVPDARPAEQLDLIEGGKSAEPELDRSQRARLGSEARAARLSAVTTDAIAAYNATLAKPHGLLPAVQLNNDIRQKNVKRCVDVARQICERQYGAAVITAEFWTAYFVEVNRDDFRSGRKSGGKGHENWTPDFEYLTRPDVMTAVFERAMSEDAA